MAQISTFVHGSTADVRLHRLHDDRVVVDVYTGTDNVAMHYQSVSSARRVLRAQLDLLDQLSASGEETVGDTVWLRGPAAAEAVTAW